jgi:hypothetical protein
LDFRSVEETRLALPLMLAGPILRRVEPNLVAVWVALSRAATVKLTLWQGLKDGVAAAVAHDTTPIPVAARRIGDSLHVALVTLKLAKTPQKTLVPGINYSYDLEIVETPGGVKHTLATLGLLGTVHQEDVPGVNHEPLGYGAGLLPSFSLPPAELADLRIVYGSCRRPCNDHADAMPWIDDLIERARPPELVGNPRDEAALRAFALARPHQLFLGGDQIYADDVSPLQLAMCNRLGHELLSGSVAPPDDKVEKLTITGTLARQSGAAAKPALPESLRLGFESPSAPPPALPLPPVPVPVPATLDFFPAGGRLDLTQFDAQMTSSDGESHLLSFGEFAAMHLMVWSNTCWDAARWPDNTTIAEAPGKVVAGGQPAHIASPMDVALAEYLEGRWDDWNTANDPKKYGPGAAGFLKRTWIPGHAGFADFSTLSGFEKGLFRSFMKQMQARVVRHLAERVGILRLADSAAVRALKPVAIKLLGKQRQDQYAAGGADLWKTHLEDLLQATTSAPPITWDALIRASLPARDKEDDPVVDQIEALATKWIDDPAAGERAAHRAAGYQNLSLTAVARCLEALARGHVWAIYRRLQIHRDQLLAFEKGLPKVRRAMANVPTYMIFDDHDVTDDWNLNPIWCERVLKDERSLGRQLVRNGMAAYALFQDWGNDPLRYESGTALNLLGNIAAMFGSAASPSRPDGGATRAIDGFLGLDKLPQPENPLKPNERYKPVNAPMKWHYSVGGPKHQVVVLDNRTRRSYASRNGPPGNVAISMQADQIPPAPLPDGKEVLIVVAPLQVLAPSIFDEIIAPGSYRAFDLAKPTEAKAKGRGYANMAGTNPDAIEGWALDPITFEALLERLAPHRQVLLLSGDVHYSAATQMSYWRKGEALPARLLQFTSSGIKNVMPGYLVTIDHSLAFAQQMVRSDIGGERLGWKAGATGAFAFPPGKSVNDVPLVLRKRLRRTPAHLPTYGWPVDRSTAEPTFTTVKPELRPDFSWRLAPVFDTRADAERPPMARPLAFEGSPPDEAKLAADGAPFEAYRQIAARHQVQLDRLGNSRQILFRSNIAQVRFASRTDTSGPAPRQVLEAVHEIYTAVPDPSNVDPKERTDPTPLAYVVQRAALTPDPNEPRPEDLPLKGGLAESIAG